MELGVDPLLKDAASKVAIDYAGPVWRRTPWNDIVTSVMIRRRALSVIESVSATTLSPGKSRTRA